MAIASELSGHDDPTWWMASEGDRPAAALCRGQL